MSKQLTQQRLKELVEYDPVTGCWYWARQWYGKTAGSLAGCSRPDGYLVMGLDGTQYLAHRLAFLYMEGEIPSCEVDHKDGDPSNCKWDNLRACDRITNSQNQRRAKRGRSPGAVLGASFDKRRNVWRARIVVNKVERWIGSYATPSEAHAAYIEAKRNLHSGCTI